MSWGNWDFGGRTTRQQAANDFLNTGNFNTAFGGTACRGSGDCASGFACVNGRCVQKGSQESSTGGTCGEGVGGGGCGGNSVTISDNLGQVIASGDVVTSQGTASGTIYKTFAWTPVYSDDGCTVTGCSLEQCGGGMDGDCPQGERSCRYGASGAINCFCGDPEPSGCSIFCTAYSASSGEVAAGCSGLACDECSYCEEIFVSASGICKPRNSGSPCHCKNEPIPACHKCDENGTVVPDEGSCQECITIHNYACDNCGERRTISRTCCRPVGIDGLSLTNKCQSELQQACDGLCPPPDETEPPPASACLGVNCVSRVICGPGSCPPLPPNAPGRNNIQSGCIEAGGNGCTLYYECDVSNLPPECGECDCNCNNDCPDCQLCGTDGKCYPDPSCCEDDDMYIRYKRTYKRWDYQVSSYSWGSLACDNNPPGYFSSGDPCSAKCLTLDGIEEETEYYCFRKTDVVEIREEGTSFTGFSNLGCCETNPGTIYRLYVNGDLVSGSSVTINGGSTSSGGGQQNNCYYGGYHFFEAVDAKCGGCPS